MKSLTLVAKGRNTCEAVYHQLNDLLGDRVQVEAYYTEEEIKPYIGKDLIVVTSPVVLELTEGYLNPDCPRIVALRSINYQEIDTLLNLPTGTQALLVNDCLSAALDTISLLKTIGVNHIEYFPCVPELSDYPKLKLAITPGEPQFVPDCVEIVLDIKSRNIDFITLVEILKKLSLLDEKANLLSARYVSGIIELIKKNKKMALLNKQMKNQLETIINTVRDGIIALDEQEHITVFNSVAGELLGCRQAEIIGKNLVDRSIREDIRTLLRKTDGRAETFVKINGKHFIVNTSPIAKEAGEKGKVITFNDVTEIQRLEEEHRRELISQQNFARYTFDHILGDSLLLSSTKKLAQKIARSDSPILIQGESGTGKELFAQSIHNASPRKSSPFIAVNFAALSENLLESELFGYEEGAFTGAKKGGMAGLFQQAHKGTIFLDEIGDSPLAFQVKLLRVLQEKQVRRIGSSRVIPIDVRVIVATNKNPKELIDQGLFRQDLYYRLNVLPIKVPPLRERKQDVLTLAKYFYQKYFDGAPTLQAEEYFSLIQDTFLTYDWPGNIRELQNVVEYLVNICAESPPEETLLPEELKAACRISTGEKPQIPEDVLLFNSNELSKKAKTLPDSESISLHQGEYDELPLRHWLILAEIAAANALGIPAGRRSMAQKSGFSEGVVRGIIHVLAEKGMLVVRRGRKGLHLSQTGMKLYIHHHNNIKTISCLATENIRRNNV